ncbi:hypothetical protein BC941DRAFT_499597 [Chlamydoabsidia padenii]|nr:hypothetical protein BC941DRAFT_499597 [Chlamydoabsidia padenii]
MSLDNNSPPPSPRPDSITPTPDSETLRRYDLTLTNTSLSLTVNITTILTWVNDVLAGYIKHGKLPTINDLVADWEDGRAFLCLAQRFYPTCISDPTFDTLMTQDTTTRCEVAFGLFEKELALVPPTVVTTPLYIARLRQSLASDDDPWKQRTQTILHTIQHTRQALGFHATTSRDDGTLNSAAAHPTMHDYLDGGNSNGRTMDGWEEDLAAMEQALSNLNDTLDEYHSWANANMEDGFPTLMEKDRRLALVQSVTDAHHSLQKYLDHDQQALTVFRKRSIFTKATAPIRRDLDWVQAEMLKTTTTDTGIKELENRMALAGTHLQQLIEQYSGTVDQEQQSLYPNEVDALVKRYHLVQSWVEDVRVWFVEAQRIRQWIGERIDILVNANIPNGASTEVLSITADQVEDLNTNHEAMEKEVELFNKQDMSRLRTHVKDLTVDATKEKDLSPADTTTIEITFATLTALDRLLHLLKRHSHGLQVLTLRVFWENEFAKTVDWVNTKAQELDLFIQSRARWQDGTYQGTTVTPESKSAVIDTLLDLELEISRFDQGQFTTTVNLYQEMDDTSDIELPQFLESRQVGVEEQFESLVHRVSFARRVVEQYLIMVDFMNSGNDLIYRRGYGLIEKLVQQTDKMYALFLDQQGAPHDGDTNGLDRMEKQLVDENADFQEQAVRLITDTADRIPYTETASSLDYEENEAGNKRVKAAVESRSAELILLGETLEQKLEMFKVALGWYKQLDAVHTTLRNMHNQLAQDISSATHLIGDMEEMFGDRVPQLSDTLINDDGIISNWDQQLCQQSKKIDTYQMELAAVESSIDELNQPSINTANLNTTSDTIDYLKNDLGRAASQIQSLTSILHQWRSKLSMVKDRQSWEYHQSKVTQWFAAHEQKYQHTRLESAWSPSSELHWITLCNIATDLTQEWNAFRDQSVSPLVKSFEQLINHGGQETSSDDIHWKSQRQRQTELLSRVDHMTSTILMTTALLDQWRAITQYMDGAEDIRSQGAQWLNHLKWITLHQDMEEMVSPTDKPRLNLDTYNSIVDALWKQWQSYNSSVAWDTHDDLMDEWQRQCDFVMKQSTDQHGILFSLGQTLKKWLSVAEESKKVHDGVNIWRDKVYSLDARVVDLLESLMVKKDDLLDRLSLHGEPGDMSTLTLKDMDLQLQQWLDHDFDALRLGRSGLNDRVENLRESLKVLGGTQDYQNALDFLMAINNTATHLDQLETQCRSQIKPLLSFVSGLVETFKRQVSWDSTCTNLSLLSQGLQDRMKDLVKDKEVWLEDHDYSLTKVQAISRKVVALGVELDQLFNPGNLLDSENEAYIKMEQAYHDLSSHGFSDTICVSSSMQNKHIEYQQSIPHIMSNVKQLGDVIKWLETGASWLHRADNQLGEWKSFMGDLEHFTQQDAKWSVDDGGAQQTLALGATLNELHKNKNDLVANLETMMDAFNDWKSESNGVGATLVGFMQKKVAALENYRSDAGDYLIYTSNMINHQNTMQQWSNKVSDLEYQGERVKSALLVGNGDLDGESLQLLHDFDQSLAGILNSDQNMDYPAQPSSSNIFDNNTILHQYIESRQENLENLSISLHRILNTKERSARLKALVDGYINNAMEASTWIKHAYDKLEQEMATDDDKMHKVGTIESKLGILHELEDSIHLHANMHYNGLKESADSCVAAIQMDADNDNGDDDALIKVTTLRQQLNDEWKQLSDSLQHHKIDLQQAERIYWSDQVVAKCKAIDDQLNNINISMADDSTLDQWRLDLDGIKSNELDRLGKLCGLDDNTRGIVDHATDIHQQLDKRLAAACHDVQCERQRSDYADLAGRLLTLMVDIKPRLENWQSSIGAFPVEIDASADEAYYNRFKAHRSSLLDDWSAMEQVYKQEQDMYLSVDNNANTEGLNQKVVTRWMKQQQELKTIDECYHSMTRRRPLFDKLHQIASLLDNIDTSLHAIGEGGDEDDIYVALKQVDRVRGMMADSSSSMDQQQQHDEDGGYNAAIYDIYQQRRLVLGDRLDTLDHQLDMHQKQLQIRRSHQQLRQMAEEIKLSAQKESATLASSLTKEEDLTGFPLDTQQYHGWGKSVTSSEKIYQDLLHETKVLVASVSETEGLQQTDADQLAAICQGPLDDLKNNILKQRNMMDLARQVLGHSKSAKDINIWLANFCSAVDELMMDDGSAQVLGTGIDTLKTKLLGFEPTVTSLETMNKGIQGTNIIGNDQEMLAASLWKQSAQQQHDQTTMHWKESQRALEKAENIRHRLLYSTTLARKMELMVATIKHSSGQIDQLQRSLVAIVSSTTTNGDDQDHVNLFKLAPREPDILQAQQSLESLELGLVAQGRDMWNEINRLIDQQSDDMNGGIVQQWEKIERSWSKLNESIKNIKDTLHTAKSMVKCISMMDGVDVLLDSMDDVVLKAAPHYHATMVDNKYSKAELEAKRIELDARSSYYKHNINEGLRKTDEAWTEIGNNNNNNNQILNQLSSIVEQHKAAQHTRYMDIFNRQAPARQLDLEKALKLHLADATEKLTRLRKSSLPTRKAAGTLIPTPRPTYHTTSTGLHPSSALQGGRQRHLAVSSSSSLIGGDSHLPRPHGSTTSSTLRKKSKTPLIGIKKTNDYVAQDGNDLDIEIGRIVNDMPYRVKVKMVPGEIGRYWFGDINPKLVYCRVLKSKMVMVRVGGGWAELSQFLRDHAKLEGELIISKQQDQHLLHTDMQEGYLETTTSLQRQRKQLLEQNSNPLSVKPTTSSTLLPTPRATSLSSSIPKLKSSRSSTSKSTTIHDPLEMKLSRFGQKSALPTSATNRRRKNFQAID